MRYCKTCQEWREDLKNCLRRNHDIDWNNFREDKVGMDVCLNE